MKAEKFQKLNIKKCYKKIGKITEIIAALSYNREAAEENLKKKKYYKLILILYLEV